MAEALGVRPSTVRSYVSRGVMPAADGYDKHGPWWWNDTFQGWTLQRPGRGRWGR